MIKRKGYLALCAALGACHYTHAVPGSFEIEITDTNKSAVPNGNKRVSYLYLYGMTPDICTAQQISPLLKRLHSVLSKSNLVTDDDCSYLKSVTHLLTFKEIARVKEWCKTQDQSNDGIQRLTDACIRQEQTKEHDDMIIAMSRMLVYYDLERLDPEFYGNEIILDMGEGVGKVMIPEFIQDLLFHAVPAIKNSKNAQDEIAKSIQEMLLKGECKSAPDKANEYIVTADGGSKKMDEMFASCVKDNAYHPLVNHAANKILLEAFESQRSCCKTRTWTQLSLVQSMSLKNLKSLDALTLTLKERMNYNAIRSDHTNLDLVRKQIKACIRQNTQKKACSSAACVVLPTAGLVVFACTVFVYRLSQVLQQKDNSVPSLIIDSNDSNRSNDSNASITTTSATEQLHSWQYLMQLAINQTDHQSLAVTLADPMWNWQSGIQCPAMHSAFNDSEVSVPAKINGVLGSYNISMEQMMIGAECAKSDKREWSQYSCVEAQTADKDTTLAQGHLLNPALFGDFFTLYNGTFTANTKALRPMMESSALFESNAHALVICNASCKDNTVFENPCAGYVQADSKFMLHNIYKEDGLWQRIVSTMLWNIEKKCNAGFTDIKYISPEQSNSKSFSNAHNTAQRYLEAFMVNNSLVEGCVRANPAIAEELSELLNTNQQAITS